MTHRQAAVMLLAPAVLVGAGVGIFGLKMGALALGGLAAALLVAGVFERPVVALYAAMLAAFFANGLGRYADLPWGVTVDGLLVLGLLAVYFKKEKFKFASLKNGAFAMASVWLLYVGFQLLNPESPGTEAWVYGMRQNGFYQVLLFGLSFIVFSKKNYFNHILGWVVALSVLGALWGLRQKYYGLDLAEKIWLFDEGNAKTHLIFGSLRAFSFYSDAGQFGVSQAMVCLMCVIVAFSPVSWRLRVVLWAVAALLFWGFANSGTRGGVVVFFAGGLSWLLVGRNFKLLAAGLGALAVAFYILKFTFLFHNYEQVRRMRSATNSDDASLQVRIRNQQIFADFLETRPFGAGIGSSGHWGAKFSRHEVLANVPTDSYFVRIWVETGIVGLCLHFLMFGFFVGRGAATVCCLRDPVLRAKAGAFFAAIIGAMVASYGNQIWSQIPTAFLTGVGIPLIFLSPNFDSPGQKNE